MARERYLVNEGEDTIHQDVIKLETAKQKRQNWWYYNKMLLIILLVAALIVGSIIYSVVTQVAPDYTIALMTSYTMPDDGLSQLENCISEYADDRNGDGQVKVTVVNYVFSSTGSDYEQQQASLVKFTADASLNECMIYLHDEAAFDSMKNNFEGFFQYNEGGSMPETATDYENAMVPWGDFKAFAGFVPVAAENDLWDSEVYRELYEKLRVSVRAAEGSSVEKSEKDMQYHEASLKLYERLKNGEKWSGGQDHDTGYYF